ncbi:MAG: hypothetical protein AB7O62_22930 [Pirellulales bacterium]
MPADRTNTEGRRPPSNRTARPRKPPVLGELFQVVVTCADEADQRRLYEQMVAAGRPCRLLLL